MSKKIDNIMKEFNSFEKSKKRELCLTVLKEVKNEEWLLGELYSLVENNTANDIEYANIYQSAIMMLENIDETIRQESINNLEKARDYLKEMKNKEEYERKTDSEESQKILTNIF